MKVGFDVLRGADRISLLRQHLACNSAEATIADPAGASAARRRWPRDVAVRAAWLREPVLAHHWRKSQPSVSSEDWSKGTSVVTRHCLVATGPRSRTHRAIAYRRRAVISEKKKGLEIIQALGKWWRWRELNPRPKALDAQFYMLSSPLSLVSRQHDVRSAPGDQPA